MFSRIPKSSIRAQAPRQISRSVRRFSSLPKAVIVTPEERSSGILSWRSLELATRALHHDGIVALENAIPHDKLDFLNEKMVADALFLQSAGDSMPFNYNKGNIQQNPPLVKRYFDPNIFLNPLATQTTSSLLGPRPRLSFISGNSALPPAPDSEPQSQPVHSDADFEHPRSPFALVINIPLVEMTLDNGTTEVWLGSHLNSGKHVQEGEHGERASGRIRKDVLAARAQERQSSQPVVRKGSIVVRDLRLWHAGKPNFTEQTRVMLAMIHFAPWFRNAMEITFSEELRPQLESDGGLQIQGRLKPEQEILDTYLKGAYGNAYDFDQKEKLDIEF
ncbi:Kanamycin B dioxygenase [Lachnellula hyalina]|uniref:Kanamycin B dioxygenase n=1 Tax=Lachnellula hyalina TaxID=1316788 RepID=A0A8H8U0T1_9HELO|nr:Kanamycin B dioxygenase [Lachnellula hyalina]TVY29665.1 Kanamycin B dioxygenase [Lachnellula hyalina]